MTKRTNYKKLSCVAKRPSQFMMEPLVKANAFSTLETKQQSALIPDQPLNDMANQTFLPFKQVELRISDQIQNQYSSLSSVSVSDEEKPQVNNQRFESKFYN